MKFLIDTHYVLWTLFEPQKISSEVLNIFNNDDDIKYVSGISLWEISLKYSLNNLDLIDSDPFEVFETIKEAGFQILELSNEEMVTYYKLPLKNNHNDPFDRMLIWQAIKNDLTLISHDNRIKQYTSDGLKLINATT